ncbi:MAG: hypothetical protein QME32_00310 [Endomicrobiia bacterium]|nr:hypothetical protein [Endomicrobiia bacterium]
MLKVTTKTVTFVPQWNGNDKEAEPIRLELARLTLEDYWKVATVCSYFGEFNRSGLDVSVAKIASCGEVVKEITPLIKKYVVGISGLYVDDVLAKAEDLSGTAQFLPLILEIIGELLRISTIDEALKKKSEASSAEGNKGT